MALRLPMFLLRIVLTQESEGDGKPHTKRESPPHKEKNGQTHHGEKIRELQDNLDVSIALTVSPQTDRWLDYIKKFKALKERYFPNIYYVQPCSSHRRGIIP